VDDTDALLRAAAHNRDDLHARLFLHNLVLASETHPELVREALAKVFDVTEVVRLMREAMEVCREARRVAIEAKCLGEAVMQDFDRLELHLERLVQKASQQPKRAAS
jgi:hypothetical protein